MTKRRCSKCNRDLPAGVYCPVCSVVNKSIEKPDLKKNITNFDLIK